MITGRRSCILAMVLLGLGAASGCSPDEGGGTAGGSGGGGEGAGGTGGTGGTGGSGGGAAVDRERTLWAPGAPDYTVADDTVADARTGLVWERRAGRTFLDFAGAVARCGALELDGRDDWRLPTAAELLSIVDFGAHAPAIDVQAFPSAIPGGTWTATRFQDDEGGGIAVDFQLGDTDSEGRRKELAVRCVRAGHDREASYEIGDETVRDTATGLTWQRDGSPPVATLEQAAAWCDELEAGGADDWRLPTIHELATLLVNDRPEPTIDPEAFPEAAADGYWSSTRVIEGTADERWGVGFGGEFSGLLVPLDAAAADFMDGPFARCVR